MSGININFFGLLVLAVLISKNAAKLPAEFKPCKAGDGKCLVATINKVIENKYKGDPDLNLVSIDPLKIAEMEIKQTQNSPVNVELKLKNAEVYGYRNFRAYKVRGFDKSPEGKHDIYFEGPFATLIGDYSLNGKVLILPVRGDGRSNITLDNVFFKVTLNAESKLVNDVTFMDVKNIKLNLNATMAHFEFTNLFNGDKVLSDTTNKLFNENWFEVYTELRSPVLRAFEKVFMEFIPQFFSSHPYAELVEGGL